MNPSLKTRLDEISLPRPVLRVIVRNTVRRAFELPLSVKARRRYFEFSVKGLRVPRGTTVEPITLGGVQGERVVCGAVDPSRAILHCHAGGNTVGSPATTRPLSAYLSRAAGAPVYSMDYRMAPEHHHPAGLEDVVAAYRALVESGIAPERVAMSGESAGAALVLAAAIRLRDAGDNLPAVLALISGQFDATFSGESCARNAKRDSSNGLEWSKVSAASYLAGQDPRDPEISPVFADLAGLPPLIVHVGGDEFLLSDSELLVERANAAGVDLTYRRFDGLWHVFHEYAPVLREAREAIAELGRELRRVWGEPATGPATSGLAAGPGRNETPSPTIAIIGAGFGGIGMGISLKKAGIETFTILEQGDGVGGVWCANTYPGAACDVPSHLYSYSFEPAYPWSRRFAPQAEILDYLEGVARKYGIDGHIRFNSTVTGAEFDEDSASWRVRTEDGSELQADALVAACGQHAPPRYPSIPGLDSFKGPAFHTARWDHEVELAGKRVAVIGTGASSVQVIPEIAPEVERLYVFQRSPGYVVPRDDTAFGRLRHRIYRHVPGVLKADRFGIWLALEVPQAFFTRMRNRSHLVRRIFEKHINEQVPDPELKAALTPDFEIGCKRTLVSSVYYPALQRDNVELVTDPIKSVTKNAVVTDDGTKREVDAIILGTGFKNTEFLAPIEIRGREGKRLNEAWADGAEAYLGITVAGFPNLFTIYGPNTNLGSGSAIQMLEAEIRYATDAVSQLRSSGAAVLEVRPEVQAAFMDEMHGRLAHTTFNEGGCTSWYLDERGRNITNWPGSTVEFARRTRRLDLSDYRLEPAKAAR